MWWFRKGETFVNTRCNLFYCATVPKDDVHVQKHSQTSLCPQPLKSLTDPTGVFSYFVEGARVNRDALEPVAIQEPSYEKIVINRVK